jgi:hypothetical protein
MALLLRRAALDAWLAAAEDLLRESNAGRESEESSRPEAEQGDAA